MHPKQIPQEVRGYSLLEIKQFDERTGRKFSGMATTPTPDRMDDVINPLGVKFSNPMPMLLFHNASMPVGTVNFGKPTKKGIPFEAEIPVVAEEGEVKSLTDKAAHFVKYGLIRAVSLGFRILNNAVEIIEETGGLLFDETEALELSLVPIPAQSEATITVVKSIVGSSSGRAALGNRPVARQTPGASGSLRNNHTMKTIAERITTFEATRQAKQARMNELMTAADEGSTLDDAQQQEYDGLEADVKGIDEHLRRLRGLEEMNVRSAVPARGENDDQGTRSRGVVTVVKDNLPPGIEFARYAMCIAAAKGNTHQALAIAKSRYPDQHRIQMVLKAAVEAGTTTDPNWAGSLVQYTQYAGDFVEFLRPQTIIGKFGTNGIPPLRRVPFNIMIKGQTSGGNGYWVGQGRPKPLTKFDFEPITLRWAKVANIAVITEELARFSNPSAEALVRDALAGAIIERMDIDFVDPDKAEVADVSPASITHGVTPIPSSGSSTAHITADVASAMGTFIGANITPTTGVWIMSATTALALSLRRNALGQKEFPDINMNGGTFEGLPVIVSQYLALVGSPTNEIVILANASDIYLADDGQVVIDVSREASLEMSDTPTNASSAGSPAAPVATSLVSLWQSNSIGLRAERFVNWKKRRAAAVTYITGVNWGSGVSPL